jgi:hypothetical protein
MRTLERDKKALYICEKIKDSDPVQFKPPVEVKLNVVATTSEADIVAFGDSYKEYRRAKISVNELDKFNEGDRAYIYVAPPLVHDVLCDTADFEIKSISDSISQASILFKRLQIGK